jgi:hypothetical protein
MNAKATPNAPNALSVPNVRPPLLVVPTVVAAAGGPVAAEVAAGALVALVPELVLVEAAPALGVPEVYAPVLMFPFPPS